MSDLAAIFQIGSFGDSIVSIPSLLSVRELLPTCFEYVLVSKFQSGLKVCPNQVFDMAWPSKHEVSYTGPTAAPRDIISVASAFARLRYYKPRYCVYLMPSARSETQVRRDAFFFRAAGIRELVGFRAVADMQPGLGRQRQRTEAYLRFHRLWGERADEKFPRYAKTPLLRPSDSAEMRVKKWLGKNRRYPCRKLVALCPFSNYTSKNMSGDVILGVVSTLEAQQNVEVIVLGGTKDRQTAETILSRCRGGLNACGTFTPEESAAILDSCSLAICVDSGPMHLAGALGKATVVTFSRINPQLHRWFPLGTDHTILHRDVECAGCKLTSCPVVGHPCMTGITAREIVLAATRKLQGFDVPEESMETTKIVNW